MSRVGDKLIPLLESYSFSIKEVVWDAFFCTRGAESGVLSGEQIEALYWEIEKIIKPELLAALNSDDGRRVDKSIRLCIVYGDISCGLRPGVKLSWGITGHARALVSKLEQMAKELPGSVFISETVLSRSGRRLISVNFSGMIPGSEEQCCEIEVLEKFEAGLGDEDKARAA